jgi:hypothetical protein
MTVTVPSVGKLLILTTDAIGVVRLFAVGVERCRTTVGSVVRQRRAAR